MHEALDEKYLPNADALARLLRRTYWIFAVEIGEVRYGIDCLVFTANRKSQVLNYLADNVYSEFMVLNRKTGKTWYFKNNARLDHRLDRVVQRNQTEFKKLSERELARTEAPFSF